MPPSVATCTLLALAVALGPCPTQAAEPAPAPGTNPDLPVEPPPPLHRDPHEETAVRRALSLGAGISGAGLVVGGLLLWRRGRRDFASDIAGLDQPILPLPAGQDRYYAVDTLLLDTRTQWIGISLATSGLGAGAVAITEAAGGGQRALLTEFGLGAAFTGGGALAIQLLKRQHVPWGPVTLDALERRRDAIAPFYALLGAGVGMAAASLISLVTHRALRRSHKRRTSIAVRGATIFF